MRKNTLFPITDTALNVGIAKFNIMLIDANTVKDILELLPYTNLILHHLSGRKEEALSDIIFEDYWAKYEKVRDA